MDKQYGKENLKDSKNARKHKYPSIYSKRHKKNINQENARP